MSTQPTGMSNPLRGPSHAALNYAKRGYQEFGRIAKTEVSGKTSGQKWASSNSTFMTPASCSRLRERRGRARRSCLSEHARYEMPTATL